MREDEGAGDGGGDTLENLDGLVGVADSNKNPCVSGTLSVASLSLSEVAAVASSFR